MKPRIGFLIPRLGITDRGAEVYIYELARNLHQDFEITVWVRHSTRPSLLLQELEKKGIVVRRIRCPDETHWVTRLPYRLSSMHKFLEKFHLTPFELEMLFFSLGCFLPLLRENIDILVVANGFWGASVCGIVRLIRCIPFVFLMFGGIQPFVAKTHPNLSIAIHPHTTDWFKTYYPQLPITYIPAGVNLRKFSPHGKKASIRLPHPIFLSVSAFIPGKRIDLTIKAVGNLKQGGLIVVGDGPLRSQLIEEARKHLGKDRFLFVNAGYSKLDEYYRTADVFTHSAPEEIGWSMVHLEALATNLPIVSNRDRDLTKLLEGSGIICDVTNIDEYAGALDRAAGMKVNISARHLAEKFSWEKIVVQYKQIFENLL